MKHEVGEKEENSSRNGNAREVMAWLVHRQRGLRRCVRGTDSLTSCWVHSSQWQAGNSF